MNSFIDLCNENSKVPRRICRNNGTCRKIGTVPERAETSDKRLAEAILGKIKVQIVEGRFFEKPTEQQRTLTELLDRHIKEHAAPKFPSGSEESQDDRFPFP
jgi:hypothetical protein